MSWNEPKTFRHPASRLGATLLLAYGGSLDSDYILYDLLSGSADDRLETLQSRGPFVSAARNLLDNLAGLAIRASEWTNYEWNAEYCENTSHSVFLYPGPVPDMAGMHLPQTALVKLNRLRAGVGQFHLSMHRWGLAPSPNCNCGASEETLDHVLIVCSIHRAPHGALGLRVWDNEIQCWLNNITTSI